MNIVEDDPEDEETDEAAMFYHEGRPGFEDHDAATITHTRQGASSRATTNYG